MAKKPEETAAETKTVSKMEAVRQAIAAGVEKPQDGVAFCKDKFGIDIPTAIFSSYKSTIAKAAGKAPGKRGRKPKGQETHRMVAQQGSHNATPKGTGTIHNGVALAKDVKKLVDSYGAEAVKEMADVFAG